MILPSRSISDLGAPPFSRVLSGLPRPLLPSPFLRKARGAASCWCSPPRSTPAPTMSFTEHSVFFTLKVSVLLGSLLGLCLGLEFMGLPNQWARYLRWDASTRSDLSFQFKTNVSTGLLLYLDDGGVCDFLCLSLVDGRVQLRVSMDCAETAVLSNKPVNDSSWHFLMVSRDRLRTVLLLDGEGQSGELQPQRPYMDVVSDLFLGGVPADIRPSALTLDGVQAMPGFKGLILDLKYGNSEPRLLGSQGVQLDAEGPCGDRPCENGGICFLLDGHPTCDCSTTGYGGKLCSEVALNYFHASPRQKAQTTYLFFALCSLDALLVVFSSSLKVAMFAGSKPSADSFTSPVVGKVKMGVSIQRTEYFRCDWRHVACGF
ncbi:Neurexin-3 [Galemys pyrenaicus]|uniref:Neurexin-3 n=1 Tax=Galemys pyrenaicus TaxID=202257 RepID=A0A8J6A2S4_GALPY|nr:Neurexin-3 [Galemys pyrenaicus]